MLFSGSLRSNLDPSDHYTDQQIWKALECAHLKSFVENQDSGIFYECGEGGLNLRLVDLCIAYLLYQFKFYSASRSFWIIY